MGYARASSVLNRWPRYYPILQFLERHPGLFILEVGSGPVGLAGFREGELVGCDLAFTEPPHPSLRPVIASAELLPFATESFDLVICQDTLEHLPLAKREGFLREAARVSRRFVYISFPQGRGARLADRLYATYHLRLRRLPLPDWLEEHFTIPSVDPEQVRSVLAQFGRVEVQRNENLAAHMAVVLIEHWPRLNRLAVSFTQSNRWPTRCCFWLANLPPTYRQAVMLYKK
jgi:SAM-dependent methyltransferase